MTRPRWVAALAAVVLAAVVLAALPVGPLPAGSASAARPAINRPAINLIDPDPPAVAGLRYEAALRRLQDWYPDVLVLVVPLGIPEDVDRDLLTVDRQLLVNPKWTGIEGSRPVVWLYLVTPVPHLVGKALGEARELLRRLGLCVSWAPEAATDDWVVTAAQPPAGTPFPVTNCAAGRTSDGGRRAVALAVVEVQAPDVREQAEGDAQPAVPPADPTSTAGHRFVSIALGTAAGLLGLLLLLGLLAIRARRRRRRLPTPRPRTQVHFPAGDLRLEMVGGQRGHVVGVRTHLDTASPILEEVGR